MENDIVMCPRFRFVEGMAWRWGNAGPWTRILDGSRLNDSRGEWPRDLAINLDDPATCGCLLALVREAWGGRIEILVLPDGSANVQVYAGRRHFFKGDRLGLALAAALMAAPTKAGEP